MKIIFYASDKSRERNLAAAFSVGVMQQQALGDPVRYTAHIRNLDAPTEACDLACVFGVKSKNKVDSLKAAGIPFLYFDKGYSRHKLDGWCEYMRVSFNNHNPTRATLYERLYDDARAKTLCSSLTPWREKGKHILLAGSSAKYHEFHGLPDPTMWARAAIKNIRQHTDRPIIYRPKPSWKDAESIPGNSFFSQGRTLARDFRDCHVVITHGSNVCYAAAVNGIPCVVLGNGATSPWTSSHINDVINPPIFARTQMINALSYHQWTLEEFRSGEAFSTIRTWI